MKTVRKSELSNYYFDKSECQNCPFNNRQGKCKCLKCLKAKNKNYLTTECNVIMQDYPDTELYRHPASEHTDIYAEFYAKGYGIYDKGFHFFPEKPVKPKREEYKALEKYENAKAEYRKKLANYNRKNLKINEMLLCFKATWAITIDRNQVIAGYTVFSECV